MFNSKDQLFIVLTAWRRLSTLLAEDQCMTSESWCLQRCLPDNSSNKPRRRCV